MTGIFGDELAHEAEQLLDQLRAKALKLATAESCTGGLIAALLTSIPGSSEVFERGFVTYSNAAKVELLGVAQAVLTAHGAVSEATAQAMVEGALRHSRADVALSITGIAGPLGGTPEKPVGLVYIGCTGAKAGTRVARFTFGDIGREEIRLASVREALRMLRDRVGA